MLNDLTLIAATQIALLYKKIIVCKEGGNLNATLLTISD